MRTGSKLKFQLSNKRGRIEPKDRLSDKQGYIQRNFALNDQQGNVATSGVILLEWASLQRAQFCAGYGHPKSGTSTASQLVFAWCLFGIYATENRLSQPHS